MRRIIFFFSLLSIVTSAQTISVNITRPAKDSLMEYVEGVISGPLPQFNAKGPDLTEHLKNIGVNWIRNNNYSDDRLDMERMFNCSGPLYPGLRQYPNWECDPTDSSNYYFEESDSLFNAIVENGFNLMFRVGGEMHCAIRDHDYQGPRNNERANYIEAAKRVVRHYLYFNNPRGNFTYLDIWTEAPNPEFWSWDTASFNNFWKDLFLALKNEFPQLKIGGPGLLVKFDEYPDRLVNKAITFLTTLYENNAKPDWLGIHTIRNDIAGVYNNVVSFRKLLRGEAPFDFVPWKGSGFFDNTEIICDAYIIARFYEDEDGMHDLTNKQLDELYNRAKGAAWQTALWIVLKSNGVEKNFWYRSGDRDSDPNTPYDDPSVEFVSGLFFGDSVGTPKKMAYGFRLRANLYRKHFIRYLNIENMFEHGQTDSLWMLSTEKDSNNFAVLISNVSLENKSVVFKLNGTNVFPSNYTMRYKIVNDDENGDTWHEWNNNNFIVPGISVVLLEFSRRPNGVENGNSLPETFKLYQNYPNPFSAGGGTSTPATTIKYSIPNLTNVGTARELSLQIRLTVYDILGRKVATLVNERQEPGNYSVQFNAKNLPAGIYFYTLRAGEFTQTKKMILLK